MQWSEVTAPPSEKKLRQFAVLCLLFFGGLGLWKLASGNVFAGGALTFLGIVIGAIGIVRPAAVRWIYTGWMVAAFPIGWTVSRVMLGALFALVFTPVAALFKLMGRDALRLTRPQGAASYWMARRPSKPADYLRQF